MTDLIAVVSTGKGTWGHVSRLIDESDFKKIVLITNDFGRENFNPTKPVMKVVVNSKSPMEEFIKELKETLKNVDKKDCAVNFISGSGKEHMALMSALIQEGVQFRMVALTKDGIKEI